MRRARRLVALAWAEQPAEHRRLLETIGAAQREVVDRPLGAYVDQLLVSSGHESIGLACRAELNHALGVWIGALRVVVIDAGNPALRGLDEPSYAAMLVRVAWHEWGHAPSIARATLADIAAGTGLLSLAPAGIAGGIRTEGYRPKNYVHEIIAETNALLVARRRRGETKQPIWLDGEIYELVTRVCGWNE